MSFPYTTSPLPRLSQTIGFLITIILGGNSWTLVIWLNLKLFPSQHHLLRGTLKCVISTSPRDSSDPIDHKFVTGVYMFLGDTFISWKSKKQSIVFQSSTKTKYRAMTYTTKGIVWLCWLFTDIRVFLSHLTPMYCDNKSSIQIAHNSVFNERTKHIEIDCHLTLHHLKHDTITLPFVPSSLQIADFFTKSYSISRFYFLVDKLSMLVVAASSVWGKILRNIRLFCFIVY